VAVFHPQLLAVVARPRTSQFSLLSSVNCHFPQDKLQLQAPVALRYLSTKVDDVNRIYLGDGTGAVMGWLRIVTYQAFHV